MCLHTDPSTERRGTETGSIAVLKEIAEALNEASDVSAAMDAILPRLSEALGLTTAWAFRFDDSRRSFVEVAASGLPPALSCNSEAPLKSGWCECQDQFMNGRLNTAINIVKCSRLRDAEGDKRGLTYHASIPLRSKGKPLGILNVAAEGHHVFTPEALGLLMTIGSQVAVAVDRAGILADERRRSQQLASMSTFAADLVSMVRVSEILEHTVTQFVDHLGYEACGVVMHAVPDDDCKEALGKLIAAAHQRPEQKSEYQYSYDEDPETQGMILPAAKSLLEYAVPHSEYRIRLESSSPRAFRQTDEDLLAAFAWHLSAALENARAYDESLTNAKWLERRKLAAELHDSVSQRLFSAKLMADALQIVGKEQVQNKDGGSKASKMLGQLSSLIADSQREMKALINTLRPIEEHGWIDRLRERLAQLQLQSQTRFHLALEVPKDYPLPFSHQDSLLKIVDEATHNIIKHALAKHANIHIWSEDARLYLTIHDDGCGFDSLQVKQGLGTSTMRDRISAIGGELQIVSRQGDGTVISCSIPGAAKGRDES